MFPFSTSTFTINRKTTVTNALGNPVPGGPAPIATNVPVYLRDLNAQVKSEHSDMIEIGLYRGACAISTDIQANDILLDENENDPDGNPVQYLVLQASILKPVYIKLHLRRLFVGA